MKQTFLILLFFFLSRALFSQNVYTINADSVKLTGCDSNELIIENHTQAVPGFLYNIGKGRTAFKRPVTKINDTFYLIGADTVKMRYPTAWTQGGNSFGTTGFLGTHDFQPVDLYSGNTRAIRLTPLGHTLIGTGTDSIFSLNVRGSSRFDVDQGRQFVVSVGDAYDIQIKPEYVGGSLITFGSIVASIGVNKNVRGAIPSNSFLMGGISPGRIAAITSYTSNPVFVVDGNGTATINGGYNGIAYGDSGITTNSNSFNFKINGGIGTGAGSTGDIIFSTGNSQASGTTIHTLTNRWWLKGSTGYLSNTSTPSSSIDVTGANGYSQLRLRTSYTPSSTTDTNGNTGDFSWDGDYFYVKTPAGWKRSALTTF